MVTEKEMKGMAKHNLIDQSYKPTVAKKQRIESIILKCRFEDNHQTKI